MRITKKLKRNHYNIMGLSLSRLNSFYRMFEKNEQNLTFEEREFYEEFKKILNGEPELFRVENIYSK